MIENTQIKLPKTFTCLDETLSLSQKILSIAVDDTKTLFHTPVVSSHNGNSISSRVMVLREFDKENRKMRFHTDYRAQKIQHYKKNPTATVIGYDPDLKIQIKLQGKIVAHFNDEITKAAWDASTTRSKKCYSVKGGSTKIIDDPSDYDIKEFNVEDGYKNFAVLIFTFKTLEFLFLKGSGHRRALHKWDTDFQSSWLVP